MKEYFKSTDDTENTKGTQARDSLNSIAHKTHKTLGSLESSHFKKHIRHRKKMQISSSERKHSDTDTHAKHIGPFSTL